MELMHAYVEYFIAI